jgi:hypothetical protein
MRQNEDDCLHDPAGSFTLRAGIPYRVVEEDGELVVRPIGTGWKRFPTTIPGSEAKLRLTSSLWSTIRSWP